jgi:hypothetical protein
MQVDALAALRVTGNDQYALGTDVCLADQVAGVGRNDIDRFVSGGDDDFAAPARPQLQLSPVVRRHTGGGRPLDIRRCSVPRGGLK